MTTKRGSTQTHRRVVWEGDVLAGNLGWAWKDVTCARGTKSGAPATRPVRLDLADDTIDVACFNGDLLLHTTIAASNVTSSERRQIAVDDPHHSLADLVRGMIKDGGHAHLRVEAGTQGDVQEMWLADQLVLTWGKFGAELPILDQIAPADWQSIPALIALRGDKPVKVGYIIDTPGVNSALARLGKPVRKTHYGADLPWTLEAEGVRGAILGTVFQVKSPVDTPEGKDLEARAFGFLDSLRKAAPPDDDEGEALDETDGPKPIDGDVDPEHLGGDTPVDLDDWEDPPPADRADDVEVVE